MLYQLSYSRNNPEEQRKKNQTLSDNLVYFFEKILRCQCGERRIRTSEVVRQQIYSLPHLAALESPRLMRLIGFEFGCEFNV